MEKHKVKLSIKWQISLMAIGALIILAVILISFSTHFLRDGMQDEALNSLHYVCQSVSSAYDSIAEGDYAMVGTTLQKGDYRILENDAMVNDFSETSGVDVTLFYGDTRRSTSLIDKETGKRMVGTTASEKVVQAVVKEGQDYSATKLEINGQNYYAYYIPMKNANGSVVGMFFAGKPSAEVDATIQSKVISVVAMSCVLIALAGLAIIFVAIRICNALQSAEETLDGLSQGDLTSEVNQKLLRRKDEVGIMGTALYDLKEQLNKTMTDIHQSCEILRESGRDLNEFSDSTNNTVSEIGHAVDDISQGAVSQAEDIESATVSVSEMGTSIEQIVSKVNVLSDASEKMEKARNDADLIITELGESGEHTYDAVKRIEQQVNLTNDSVKKIQEAVALISSIAEETNLLSLNASIEAARAGEAGRGFSVVASQIQKLAEESNTSASFIEEVIDSLTRESQNTVEAMKNMQSIIDRQQEKLTETKQRFDDVNVGIRNSRDEIKEIQLVSDQCNAARVKVVDVIQNLSAISEQNAAATEQTNASMAQLTSTMEVLAEKSNALNNLAVDLEEDLKFFKL